MNYLFLPPILETTQEALRSAFISPIFYLIHAGGNGKYIYNVFFFSIGGEKLEKSSLN